MSEFVRPMAEWSAAIVEALGVGVILLAAVYALGQAVLDLLRTRNRDVTFDELRQRLGRGILLGLELLVAGDIIHTVAVELTFTTVGVLAIIVLIRTFLSFTLELELRGRWPWQRPSLTG